jgi:hypothetical protein
MDLVIVEVAIGLAFLFLLLSIVASAANEVMAGVFHLRSRTLEKGIVNLLTGSTKPDPAQREFVDRLYAHSLVAGYSNDKNKRKPRHGPSYLSSRSFRNALLDMTDLLETTVDPREDPLRAADVRAAVEEKIGALASVNKNLEESLTAIWRSVDYSATEFRAGVERWFDRGMERVSGWYTRRVKLILFIVGLFLAVGINASAITAANRIWKDDAVRDGLLAQVENQPDDATGADATGADAIDELKKMQFPIGWEHENRPEGGWGWVAAVFGWTLTAVAVTLGAPFWFDLLGKVSNLRAAGPKPGTTLPLVPSKSEATDVRLTVASEQGT